MILTLTVILRALSLIFGLGIFLLDLWYYRHTPDKLTAWVKLSLSLCGLIWVVIYVPAVFNPGAYVVADNVLAMRIVTPAVTMTLGTVFANSIIRVKKLRNELSNKHYTR